jgi:hypothetical protein
LRCAVDAAPKRAVDAAPNRQQREELNEATGLFLLWRRGTNKPRSRQTSSNEATPEMSIQQRRKNHRATAVCVCGTKSPEISVYHDSKETSYEAQTAFDTNQHLATEPNEATNRRTKSVALSFWGALRIRTPESNGAERNATTNMGWCARGNIVKSVRSTIKSWTTRSKSRIKEVG